MCSDLLSIMECYRITQLPPQKGRFVVCRVHGQMIIHGDGFWVWSDDPRDIEDCNGTNS